MEGCGALTVLIINTLLLCIHRLARQVGKNIRLISTGLAYRLISPYTVSFQMGFSAGSSSLSDKTRYPLFFRVNAPETILYTAVVSLLHRFNWKRIAIVKQDEDLFNEVGENSPYLVLNKECHYSGGGGQGTGTANKGRNNSKNAGKKRGKPNSRFSEKFVFLSA